MIASRFGLLLLAVALTFSGTPVQAQTTTDTASLVERINAIMLEMEAIKRDLEKLKTGTVSTVPTGSVATQPSGSVLGVATTNLQKAVVYGATNDTTAKVQRLLAADPSVYEYGAATGFFGPKTQAAIMAFQSRFGLDTVGVVGPSTAALIVDFFLAYPDEKYPPSVFDSRPKRAVLGEAVTAPVVSNAPVSNASTPKPETPKTTEVAKTDNEGIKEIKVDLRNGSGLIVVTFEKGGKKTALLSGKDEKELIKEIAKKFNVKAATVESVVTFYDHEGKKIDFKSKSSNDSDIDEIIAQIRGKEDTKVKVIYDDKDDNRSFSIEEDEKDEIIAAIADELDIDEDDVEDVIEFD